MLKRKSARRSSGGGYRESVGGSSCAMAAGASPSIARTAPTAPSRLPMPAHCASAPSPPTHRSRRGGGLAGGPGPLHDAASTMRARVVKRILLGASGAAILLACGSRTGLLVGGARHGDAGDDGVDAETADTSMIVFDGSAPDTSPPDASLPDTAPPSDAAPTPCAADAQCSFAESLSDLYGVDLPSATVTTVGTTGIELDDIAVD